jgi:hypothetical protein
MLALFQYDNLSLWEHILVKSFEFPHGVYTILDHRGEWRKLHTTYLVILTLILLLHAARQKTILQLEELRETIDHRRNHGLQNNFKLRILFAVTVNFTNQVVKNTNDELLLFVTREVLKLRRLHHELRQNRRKIFLGQTIVDVLHLDLLDGLHHTLRINLS